VFTTERGTTEALISKMSFCKKLLVANWDSNTNMVEASKSYKTHEMKPGSFFCNGHHNCHVLEHLEGEKCSTL
jgi:hypothetical protein